MDSWTNLQNWKEQFQNELYKKSVLTKSTTTKRGT
jgi:hypothetical protein